MSTSSVPPPSRRKIPAKETAVVPFKSRELTADLSLAVLSVGALGVRAMGTIPKYQSSWTGSTMKSLLKPEIKNKDQYFYV